MHEKDTKKKKIYRFSYKKVLHLKCFIVMINVYEIKKIIGKYFVKCEVSPKSGKTGKGTFPNKGDRNDRI